MTICPDLLGTILVYTYCSDIVIFVSDPFHSQKHPGLEDKFCGFLFLYYYILILEQLYTYPWTCFLSLQIDPEHQRANGNLKYFEYIMAKEKDANKSASDGQSDQKTTPRRKGVAVDYLPERQKYEMLCRGEGIKMVKWKSQLCVYECVCICLCIVRERTRILYI